MHSAPTIGVEFSTKTLRLKAGEIVKAQIWDTAGQERYRAVTATHYRRAFGALLVYDITDEKSFSPLKMWLAQLREHGDPAMVVMLVGNKVDLCDRNPSTRQVQKSEALRFAQEHGLLFEETSAITTVKVKEAFDGLLERIYMKRRAEGNGSAIEEVQVEPRRIGGCCAS